MRMNTILAVASASLVSAQSIPAPPGNGTITGFPGKIGEVWDLYGCVASDNGFPTFRRVSNRPDAMDLDFCAASCDTEYFGVQGPDCYCGTELSATTSRRQEFNQCDITCPGNDDQKCGGVLSLARRQNIPVNIALTVYVRFEFTDGETTTTVTETTTATSTITSCAPDVTDCVIGVTTVTATTTAVLIPTPPADYKKIVCYGDECFAEICDTCPKHRVVCRDGDCFAEQCDTEDYNRLVICEGDNCDYATGQHGKVVCYDQTCDIQECYGEECKEKIVVREGCSGDHCPTPAPPAPKPTPACFGPECEIIVEEKPKNSTVPPVVAGADSVLPAAGAVFGMVAGLAALL